MKTALFDLDGTLADNSHRQHYVRGDNKRWDEFFAAQSGDSLNTVVADLFRVLVNSGEFCVIVVTARPERYRSETERWLTKYGLFPERVLMRRDGDRREDPIVKRELLFDLRSRGLEPHFVVDDRSSVVSMWRAEGIPCFQCADHAY